MQKWDSSKMIPGHSVDGERERSSRNLSLEEEHDGQKKQTLSLSRVERTLGRKNIEGTLNKIQQEQVPAPSPGTYVKSQSR